MRLILGIGLLTMVASLSLAAPASAVPSGTVHHAFHTPYVYPNGPYAPGNAQGRAAITASYDQCDPGSLSRLCEWRVLAYAVRFGCVDTMFNDPYPYLAWRSEIQRGNTTVSSGEVSFRMGTPNEVELTTVCLYVIGPGPTLDGTAYLVDIKSIDPEPEPEPPPVPAPAPPPEPANAPSSQPPVVTNVPTPSAPSSGSPRPATTSSPASPPPLILTRVLAKRTAKARLSTTYGSWRKGSRRRLTCEMSTPESYTCAASWRYKRKAMKARLSIRITGNVASARYI